MLGVVTQGRTRREAFEMIADAVECLVDRKGFRVTVHSATGDYFEISSDSQPELVALLLRRQRAIHCLTLEQVARNLDARSLNSYARYEQGRAMPSVAKLSLLLSALSEGSDFVVEPSKL